MIRVLPLALAALTQLAVARSAAPDPALQELSQCDGTFFATLQARQAVLERAAPMRSVGSVSTFVVPDRRHPTKSRVLFAQPIEFRGLKLVGFFDEVVDIPNGMISYSWGYLVADPVPSTAAAIKPILWDAARLREDGPVFVRSEVWSHDKSAQGWAKVVTEPGVPQRGTIERVFLIEPYDGESAFIRAGCSIQGNITEPVLRELRPDLRP